MGISSYIGRYNSNGTLDTTFAPSSSTPGFDVFSTGAMGLALTLQTDGKIVATGGLPSDHFAVSRFLNDGLPAGPASAPVSTAAAKLAADTFFADLRAVSLLLSSDGTTKKH